ncbi:DUF2971 domain-containing protein [Yersinia pseudotuberculosis]|nr:DUF2971 domain-containing protein [Yersinia pseudotuberculosis]MBO1590103.1 DUF2971 domain-containing protein [Yersinia pseudotuberculosis]MBO1603564.1 DUF2971 domain-containing protein [Yersinia pseudotuberculosis]
MRSFSFIGQIHWRKINLNKKIMSDFFSDNKDDIRSQLTSNIGSYIHIFIYSYIHIFKEIFRKHAAIACFTTCCDSRLMWGYYCSGLKGFCLIYNTERINRILPQVSKVIYSKERPTLGVMSYFIRKMRGESVFAIESFAKYKHEEWSHENEYRSFLMLDDENDIVSGGVSVQLNESCIDGVIIGEECNEQTKRAIIGYSKDKGIKVFHASADLDIFRVYIS